MSEKLNDRYTLHRKIGSGTNGVTYLATDEKTNTSVVIKRLRNELNASSREIWPREAKVLRSLNHQGIPNFIDFFEENLQLENLPHIVQEYVPGKNLEQEIAERSYTPRQVLELLSELLDILVYLQSISPPVLHRDIKPENIIRHEDGKLYLIDFGTATSVRGQTFGHTMVAGTLGYQSLEQIEGDPGLSSDLYSLGVIAVRLLSGRSIEELYVGMGTIRWKEYLPHTPRILLQFLDGMLASRASNRTPNAKEALRYATICMERLDHPNSSLNSHPPSTEPVQIQELPLPKHSGSGYNKLSIRIILAIASIIGFGWALTMKPCWFGKNNCFEGCKDGVIDACLTYVDSYPDDDRTEKAYYKMCRLHFAGAGNQQHLEYCEVYEQKYPEGKYLSEIEFFSRMKRRISTGKYIPPQENESSNTCGSSTYSTVGPNTGQPELHYFSVYHPLNGQDIYVHITRTNRLTLVLSSYDAANWIVTTDANVNIDRILLNGYHTQSISAPSNIPVENRNNEEKTGNFGYHCGYAYPGDNEACRTDLLLEEVTAYTGIEMSTFFGCYAGERFFLE